MGIDLDPLDDIFAGEEVNNAKVGGKFQPKPKFRPQKKASAAPKVSFTQAGQTSEPAKSETIEPGRSAKLSEQCSDVVHNDNDMDKAVGENADIFIGLEALGDFPPHTNTAMDPVTEDSTQGDISTCPELSKDLEPLTCQMHDRELEREDMDVLDSIITSDLTTKPGQRTGKFQPKPKVQFREEKELCEVGGPDSVPPPKVNYGENESLQHDDVLDLSSLEFPQILTTDSEVPLDEDSVNLMEMNQLDSSSNLSEVPAKLASRRAKNTGSDPSPHQQNSPPSNQENETRRSLRPRKTNTNFSELVDAIDEEPLANGEHAVEYPPSEEENISSEALQPENESQAKKPKRKYKKNEDKEKPARKRNKGKESSDKDADAKPKKFSHSTRRRRVNQALLETPEDEIDFQKVPLRDLILLAEHREKQMKKEEAEAAAAAATATGGGAQATNQSNGNSSGQYAEDEDFNLNQDGEYDYEEEIPVVEESSLFFNYQTYMNKPRTIRWSKQDTELFYEAVRQFGTDFSMIQQLFPDRTRRQVMLKYKKEERQHPMRLHEAFSSRSKDFSHYETVEARVKQMAAKENPNAGNDGAVDLTDNEVADEGNSNANVEEAKDERVEEEENGDVRNDSVKEQSPVKSDDEEDEDDDFLWSQYKSEI